MDVNCLLFLGFITTNQKHKKPPIYPRSIWPFRSDQDSKNPDKNLEFTELHRGPTVGNRSHSNFWWNLGTNSWWMSAFWIEAPQKKGVKKWGKSSGNEIDVPWEVGKSGEMICSKAISFYTFCFGYHIFRMLFLYELFLQAEPCYHYRWWNFKGLYFYLFYPRILGVSWSSNLIDEHMSQFSHQQPIEIRCVSEVIGHPNHHQRIWRLMPRVCKGG